MTKSRRRRQKRSGDSSISIDEEGNVEITEGVFLSSSPSSFPTKNGKHGDLSFAERRELQRKTAADKRRQKMKCHLCGKVGHLRRECPGIADDGRGESKYTKSHGDAGSILLKQAKQSKKQNRKHRSMSGDSGELSATLELPDGFQNLDTTFDGTTADDRSCFRYVDAGCESAEQILDYLRFGRHSHGHAGHNHHYANGHHNAHSQLSRGDAIREYETAMTIAMETTNFGGCLSRLYLSSTTEDDTDDPMKFLPFSIVGDAASSLLRFVVGFSLDCDLEGPDNAALTNRLVDYCRNKTTSVAGLFADLDYSPGRHPMSNGQSRELQLKRLRCTLEAASILKCPVQIRLSPGCTVHHKNSNSANTALDCDPYSEAVKDLGRVLLENEDSSPPNIHLSCWNGKAEHMMALLRAFPNNLYIGFDGHVSFSKAIHLHECAFEISLARILLETGSPGTIPSKIAKQFQRDAFCHSGHIPVVAEAIAKHASKNPKAKHEAAELTRARNDDEEVLPDINARIIAQCASKNTLDLYGPFGNRP